MNCIQPYSVHFKTFSYFICNHVVFNIRVCGVSRVKKPYTDLICTKSNMDAEGLPVKGSTITINAHQ